MAVPDIISPSYFTAEAAVVLGCFEQGIHAEVELISPVEKTYAALRDGEIEIVAGSAHSALSAFPRWQGVKLLCAQSQGMYSFWSCAPISAPAAAMSAVLKAGKSARRLGPR